ncbi:homeobox-leucine zipper protein HAT4 [Senna tora]|uniref:Homeobox-leucine zipper protein HAT4 n=1 Tax=Senna tora TaxID=362788 RepID=A0A834TXA3_9FABA|nr:homeobox-leucine zipper protein HAT4 [Senna tora]
MVEKEDLGLSLSLSFPHNPPNHLHLNLMPSSTSSPSPSASNLHKPSWNDPLAFSDRDSETCRGEGRSFLRGIDVNRLPSGVDCEEEAGVSSPNSTISSVSGKRSEREAIGEEHDLDRDCSRGISDEEDGETSRKKLRLSKDQSAILEESFKEHNTLNPKQKLALAKQLGLRPRQVEVWFQNRRARTKLKQTEVDCEFLKRCCENLTEENRRLQKEVQELRALKLSPHLYMQMTPPTTLTMCPSCERVAVPPYAPAGNRHHPMAQAHPRPIPVGPWAHAAAPHRPFDALHPSEASFLALTMEGTSGSKGGDTLDGDTIELEEKKHVTVEVSKHALVGKVLAPKPLNRRTVRSMLIRSWGFPKGLHIVDLQMNTFLFNFSEADTPNRIMEDAPWSVLGYLVSLQRWVPEVAIHEVDYDLIPFWVQIHGAPLNGISENNARRIAERMGEVLTVENPFMENKIVRGFMRARVMVDITKTFATGFWVPRGELPKVWVTLSYEKLQGYCYNCGCLGHEQKDCKEKRAMAIWDPSKPRYGPTLGVPPVKPMHLVLSEMGMRQNREATEERSSGAWRHAQAESDKPSETVGELARGGGGNGLQKVTPAIRELQQRNWSGMAPDKKDNEGRAEGYDAGRTEKMDVERDGMGKDDVERQEHAKRYSMYNSLAEAQFGMQAQLLPWMDLKRELIRPGLGPAHLGDLDIEPEDIGLSRPVIIIDVKSPPKCKPYFTPKGPSPIDLDEELSIEEITRCREAIQNSQYKGKQAQGYYQGNDPKENSQLAIWGPRSQTKERENADYIVELPPDEAEQVEDYDGKSLQSSGEQAIVKALSANLSLKRTREGSDEEDPSGNKKTKTSLSQLAERRDEENETQEMEVSNEELKAEEAGRIMPPTTP